MTRPMTVSPTPRPQCSSASRPYVFAFFIRAFLRARDEHTATPKARYYSDAEHKRTKIKGDFKYECCCTFWTRRIQVLILKI